MKTLLLFSAMCFAIVFSLHAQVPNNGFETWENDVDGNWNPKFWTTSNSTPDTNVVQYTPAYAGNYSMQLSTLSVGGSFVLPGVSYIIYPSHQRPTQMTICMRSTVTAGDQILVYYTSWRNDTTIAAVGDCSFHIDSTMSQFHCLTFPISYQRDVMIPDTAEVMIIVGNLSTAQVGTSLIVDEITLSGNDNGINETSNDNSIDLFPNPSNDKISIFSSQSEMQAIEIYDVTGRNVYSEKKNLKSATINLKSFASGIYFLKAELNDGTVTVKKFVKSE